MAIDISVGVNPNVVLQNAKDYTDNQCSSLGTSIETNITTRFSNLDASISSTYATKTLLQDASNRIVALNSSVSNLNSKIDSCVQGVTGVIDTVSGDVSAFKALVRQQIYDSSTTVQGLSNQISGMQEVITAMDSSEGMIQLLLAIDTSIQDINSILGGHTTTLTGLDTKIADTSLFLINKIGDVSTFVIGKVNDTSVFIINKINDDVSILNGRVRDTSSFLIGKVNDTSTFVVNKVNLDVSTLNGRIKDTSSFLIGKVNDTSTFLIGKVNDTSTFVVNKMNFDVSTLNGKIIDTSSFFVRKVNDTSTFLIGKVNDTSVFVIQKLDTDVSTLNSRITDTSSFVIGKVNDTSTFVVNKINLDVSTLSGRIIDTSSFLIGKVNDTSTFVVNRINSDVSTLNGRIRDTSSFVIGKVNDTSSFLVSRLNSDVSTLSSRISDTSTFIVNKINNDVSTLNGRFDGLVVNQNEIAENTEAIRGFGDDLNASDSFSNLQDVVNNRFMSENEIKSLIVNASAYYICVVNPKKKTGSSWTVDLDDTEKTLANFEKIAASVARVEEKGGGSDHDTQHNNYLYMFRTNVIKKTEYSVRKVADASYAARALVDDASNLTENVSGRDYYWIAVWRDDAASEEQGRDVMHCVAIYLSDEDLMDYNFFGSKKANGTIDSSWFNYNVDSSLSTGTNVRAYYRIKPVNSAYPVNSGYYENALKNMLNKYRFTIVRDLRDSSGNIVQPLFVQDWDGDKFADLSEQCYISDIDKSNHITYQLASTIQGMDGKTYTTEYGLNASGTGYDASTASNNIFVKTVEYLTQKGDGDTNQIFLFCTRDTGNIYLFDEYVWHGSDKNFGVKKLGIQMGILYSAEQKSVTPYTVYAIGKTDEWINNYLYDTSTKDVTETVLKTPGTAGNPEYAMMSMSGLVDGNNAKTLYEMVAQRMSGGAITEVSGSQNNMAFRASSIFDATNFEDERWVATNLDIMRASHPALYILFYRICDIIAKNVKNASFITKLVDVFDSAKWLSLDSVKTLYPDYSNFVTSDENHDEIISTVILASSKSAESLTESFIGYADKGSIPPDLLAIFMTHQYDCLSRIIKLCLSISGSMGKMEDGNEERIGRGASAIPSLNDYTINLTNKIEAYTAPTPDVYETYTSTISFTIPKPSIAKPQYVIMFKINSKSVREAAGTKYGCNRFKVTTTDTYRPYRYYPKTKEFLQMENVVWTSEYYFCQSPSINSSFGTSEYVREQIDSMLMDDGAQAIGYVEKSSDFETFYVGDTSISGTHCPTRNHRGDCFSQTLDESYAAHTKMKLAQETANTVNTFRDNFTENGQPNSTTLVTPSEYNVIIGNQESLANTVTSLITFMQTKGILTGNVYLDTSTGSITGTASDTTQQITSGTVEQTAAAMSQVAGISSPKNIIM